ncbi:Chorismate mutase I (EC 5.4.99.5) / Prephenate dehydratase (EC 4.2.1.51) [uncultured Gammaproteobacteria bacterium]|jgi:chorismate mutase/prephenate dehydratase|uniref:prephenate dehydratase n=1 Tax=thiotrophic endosymbiont of Bathymodiolus puteoserpentis (Logatchev) TaxID=343240 RepID=UPI0010B54E09|nr:prephenate dehydratase [thiotrophic endosymbiont of Bathymodiolus puteoserpentis (Logatchev)]CAC9498043.1 Chorismate mutase I (EC 5.4.99.5) / Prephenate dehydratase (EC 4.2.1.51) [uncultured Gammaproteobacteria bacterium]CAC9584622.1 Chorismate mutase I (EC 5.4.99.5) / Prephenate dehydratase (EC 4.2.1.51) [uncultured Gammaproteobacteria bacterium]CAC9587105.1 Chorismate mutase I (EC 5.4.99.5) / Prephenate dehydratase (EC 4.2.1.51) [uncultured Gammaproteobacteria bacterium]CAC9646657.1 Choris
MAKELEKLRVEIDALDKKIQSLIGSRAELASAVAEVKKTAKYSSSFYRPEREAQVLRTIIERNDNLVKDKDMAHIFREIMSACLALEQGINVAYLGPEGTFTQEAALKHFGHAVSTLDCGSVDEVFHEVEKGNANYGVVPIENSSNGVIGATVDMLYSQDLKICGEVEVLIHHQLMMADQSKDIEVIYAHQQALEQCQRWLKNHYPKAQLKSVASNALAARLVKDEPNAAAIASEVALGLYALERVAKNIEDKTGNVTRFLVLGKEEVAPSGKDKTSLLVVAKHEAGALFDLLSPFKDQNINILQLARHPMPGIKWEYLFLIDIDGHQQEAHVHSALVKIAKKVLKVDILGSYPVTVL